MNENDDLDFGNTIQGFAPGQKLSKRYSLNRTLGEGGMGVVWLVRDEELKRDIAMKFLPEMLIRDREAIAELKKETNRSLELTHANIVRIYDFVQEGNWAGISMEYVDGDTLSALKIEQSAGCFDAEEIAPWIEQLCQALAYAHEEARVVHRDLKPTNLMVTKSGKLKVADFGISGTLTDSMSRVSIRATSGGTLVYMSPQQAMGEPPSATDDIYSLGATMYDLLCGKPPFHSGDIITQVREKAPTPISERRTQLGVAGKQKIPPHWEATVMACLQKQPGQRPQSAREVADRLFQPQQHKTGINITLPSLLTLPALEEKIGEKIGQTIGKLEKLPMPPRGKLVSMGTAVFVALVAVIGGILLFRHPEPVPVPPNPVAQATPVPAASVAPQATPAVIQQPVAVVPAPTVAPAPTTAPVAAPTAVAVAPAPTAAPMAAPTAAPAVPSPTAAIAVAPTPMPAPTAEPVAAPSPAGPGLESLDASKLLAMAQAGTPAAQGLAGLWYGAGYKFPQDYKQSLQWATQASNAGDPVGQFALALLEWSGNGRPQDKDAAKALAAKAVPQLTAMGDNPTADYCLATAYEQGLGAGQDQQKALALFEKQAVNGDALAEYGAGWMYANGEGTTQDFEKAGEMFQEAANQGHADALVAMALLYQDGKGVTKDPDKAIEFWQQAADRGSLLAEVNLGQAYAQGKGVTKDAAKAAGLFQKAADAGSAQGLYCLGWVYANGTGVTKDLAKAAGFYQQASDLGFAPANAMLALAYADGDGVTKDLAKATDFYGKSTSAAGAGASILTAMEAPLAGVLESATNASVIPAADDAAMAAAATPAPDDNAAAPAAANLDSQLAATWETTTIPDGETKRPRWQIAKTGKYTLTGPEQDSGTVAGSEGALQQVSASGTLVQMAYLVTGSTMETYGPEGLVKWRHAGSGSGHSSGHSSGGDSGSGSGFGHKLKSFFHL